MLSKKNMSKNKTARLFNAQQGASLIEALVAIVIMTLGVLGILGIQMRSLADTQTSVRRAQAIRLVEDLSERMKVNPSASNNIGSYTVGWNTTLTAGANCATSACNGAQLAEYDRTIWKQMVQATLPLADVNIFIPADETVSQNRRQLGVMISWRENEASNNADYKTPLAMPSTGTAAVSCPASRTCHIQYIQLNARCAPFTADATVQLFCPASKS